MTKKSEARLKKDELKQRLVEETQPPYQELHKLHNDQIKQFGHYHQLALQVIHPEVMANLENIDDTNKVLKVMSADVKHLRQRCEAIHSQFATKDPSTPIDKLDQEEYFAALMLTQEYADIQMQHINVILPNASELKSHVDAALKKIAANSNSVEQPAEPAEPAADAVTETTNQ